MSIEIDFSYAIDGLYHTVNYYRSLTPMDPDSMPAATTTGITGTTYTDTTATLGTVYYVRFGSVRSGIEKISDEYRVEVGDPNWNSVVLYSRLNSSAADLSIKNNTPTPGSLVTYVDAKFGKGISCNGTPNTAISYPATNFAIAVGQDFTIESWLNCSAKPTTYFYAAFGNWSSNTGICVFVKPSAGFQVSVNTANISTSTPYNINEFIHVAIVRASGLITLYVNGVSVGNVTHNNAIGAKTFFLGGNGVATDYWRGIIDEVRVTIGVARYTTNFTPQTKEFYNF